MLQFIKKLTHTRGKNLISFVRLAKHLNQTQLLEGWAPVIAIVMSVVIRIYRAARPRVKGDELLVTMMIMRRDWLRSATHGHTLDGRLLDPVR